MEGEYLSEIVNTNEIKRGKLNLIYATCGSGKTTFAKTELQKIKPEALFDNTLFLIDSLIITDLTCFIFIPAYL